jgi:hypothetical protein
LQSSPSTSYSQGLNEASSSNRERSAPQHRGILSNFGPQHPKAFDLRGVSFLESQTLGKYSLQVWSFMFFVVANHGIVQVP